MAAMALSMLAYMLTLSPWLLRNQLASEATERASFICRLHKVIQLS